MEWGLKKDPAKVKASHFPAFTERVIYWAPDSLSSQMSWALPHGGYEAWRDHRPVTLEALMILGPQHSLPPLPPADDPDVKELPSATLRCWYQVLELTTVWHTLHGALPYYYQILS
eukprot:Skav205689  [mRNA]  locus=scaffold2655:150199:152629:- [translate_table: standard]